jgi:hypothetical protein
LRQSRNVALSKDAWFLLTPQRQPAGAAPFAANEEACNADFVSYPFTFASGKALGERS